jgi:hypothetical protein
MGRQVYRVAVQTVCWLRRYGKLLEESWRQVLPLSRMPVEGAVRLFACALTPK